MNVSNITTNITANNSTGFDYTSYLAYLNPLTPLAYTAKGTIGLIGMYRDAIARNIANEVYSSGKSDMNFVQFLGRTARWVTSSEGGGSLLATAGFSYLIYKGFKTAISPMKDLPNCFRIEKRFVSTKELLPTINSAAPLLNPVTAESAYNKARLDVADKTKALATANQSKDEQDAQFAVLIAHLGADAKADPQSILDTLNLRLELTKNYKELKQRIEYLENLTDRKLKRDHKKKNHEIAALQAQLNAIHSDEFADTAQVPELQQQLAEKTKEKDQLLKDGEDKSNLADLRVMLNTIRENAGVPENTSIEQEDAIIATLTDQAKVAKDTVEKQKAAGQAKEEFDKATGQAKTKEGEAKKPPQTNADKQFMLGVKEVKKEIPSSQWHFNLPMSNEALVVEKDKLGKTLIKPINGASMMGAGTLGLLDTWGNPSNLMDTQMARLAAVIGGIPRGAASLSGIITDNIVGWNATSYLIANVGTSALMFYGAVKCFKNIDGTWFKWKRAPGEDFVNRGRIVRDVINAAGGVFLLGSSLTVMNDLYNGDTQT